MHGRTIRDLLKRGRFDVVQFNNVSLVGGPGLLSYGAGAIRLYEAHEHWLVCPTHVLWRHNREVSREAMPALRSTAPAASAVLALLGIPRAPASACG